MKTGRVLQYIIAAITFSAIFFQWCVIYGEIGPKSTGMTNAPNEKNCSSCHSGTSYSPSSRLGLFSSTATNKSNPSEYIPDSTYSIYIELYTYGTSSSAYGFQVTALYKSGTTYKMAGTFNITDSVNTEKSSATISGGTREYVSGGGRIGYAFNWKAPSGNVGDIVFYVTAVLGDGNQKTTNDISLANTFTFKASNKLPVSSIKTLPAPASICMGDSISLEAVATNNPTRYKWSITGPASFTSTIQKPTFTFAKSGNYTAKLIAYNNYGPSTEVSVSLQVKAKPADTIFVSGSTVLCKGDSVKLTAPLGASYFWNTGQISREIYVKRSGKFFVTIENANGCATTTTPVTIYAPPKPYMDLIRVYENDTICTGDSISLESLSNSTIRAYNLYNKGLLIQSASSNIFSTKNLVAGKYYLYVIGIDTNGCTTDTSNAINVFVKPKMASPLLSVGKVTSSSVNVNWSAITGANGYEISIDSGRSWKATGVTTYTINNLSADTMLRVYVRATDYTACKYGNVSFTDVKTLTCKEITYNIQYDSVVCEGESTVINFSNFNSKYYAVSVNGEAPTTDSKYTIKIIKDTSLVFDVIDSNMLACNKSQRIVNIRAIKLPPVILTLSKKAYCEKEDVDVKITTGYKSYTLYRNSKLLQTTADNELTRNDFNNNDTIYVVASTVEGCTKTSEKVIVRINKRTQPGFTYTSNNLKVAFTDTSKFAVSRVWHFGDNATSTDPYPQHIYTIEGQYKVTLITSNNIGCTDTVSKILSVTSVGIRELENIRKAEVFPNPCTNQLNLHIQALSHSNATVVIRNMRGKTVLTYPCQLTSGKNEISIPVSKLNSGTYLVQILAGNDIVALKIIKAKE